SALSDRHAGGNVLVLDAFEFDAPRTKRAVELLGRLELADRKLLLVGEGTEDAAMKSFRNLPEVHLLSWDQLNTYDVLYSDAVVFTRAWPDAFLGPGKAPPRRSSAAPRRARAPPPPRPARGGRPPAASTAVAEPEDDELVLEEAPAAGEEASDEETAGRHSQARGPREELRAAGRQHLHLHRASQRQQDRDQGSRPDDLLGAGDEREHAA